MPRPAKLPDLSGVDITELKLIILAVLERHGMGPEWRRSMRGAQIGDEQRRPRTRPSRIFGARLPSTSNPIPMSYSDCATSPMSNRRTNGLNHPERCHRGDFAQPELYRKSLVPGKLLGPGHGHGVEYR